MGWPRVTASDKAQRTEGGGCGREPGPAGGGRSWGGSGAWGEEGYFLFLLWVGDAGEVPGPQDRHGGRQKRDKKSTSDEGWGVTGSCGPDPGVWAPDWV